MRQITTVAMYLSPAERGSTPTMTQVPTRIRWAALAEVVGELDRIRDLIAECWERKQAAEERARQAELDARASQAEAIAAGGPVKPIDRTKVEKERRKAEDAEAEMVSAQAAYRIVWEDRLIPTMTQNRSAWLADSEAEIERCRREYAVAIENLVAARDARLAAIGERIFLEKFPHAIVKAPAAGMLNQTDTIWTDVLIELRREAGTERQLPRTLAQHVEAKGGTPAAVVGGPSDEAARVRAARAQAERDHLARVDAARAQLEADLEPEVSAA